MLSEIVRERSLGGKKWHYWGEDLSSFVKQVGFTPTEKKQASYGWAEWWNKRGRSDEWRNKCIRNRGTGTRMRSNEINQHVASVAAHWSNWHEETGWKIYWAANCLYFKALRVAGHPTVTSQHRSASLPRNKRQTICPLAICLRPLGYSMTDILADAIAPAIDQLVLRLLSDSSASSSLADEAVYFVCVDLHSETALVFMNIRTLLSLNKCAK